MPSAAVAAAPLIPFPFRTMTEVLPRWSSGFACGWPLSLLAARGLLALDGRLRDGDRVARLLDLAGEELAEDDDADDEQDGELDGGDGGGDERRVAPGLLCREVGGMIHGAD